MQIFVEIWGAGGGVGGGVNNVGPCNSYFPYGGAGGAGGYNNATVTVIPGNSYSITIGNGGIIGATTTSSFIVVSGGNGGNGGSSSFNGTLNASGGTGGGGVNTNCTSSSGGSAGAPGSVINYPPFQNPPARSYIPTTYIISPPNCCANGGNSTNGGTGEGGFCVITY